MAAEYLKLYPENPELKKIRKVAEVLRNGGIIIYPTDTVYALGCDITKPKAIEQISVIKGGKSRHKNYSFISLKYYYLQEILLSKIQKW